MNELLEVKEVTTEGTTEGTVTIPLARYEELIKKEHLIDIVKMGMFYLSDDMKKLLEIEKGEE